MRTFKKKIVKKVQKPAFGGGLEESEEEVEVEEQEEEELTADPVPQVPPTKKEVFAREKAVAEVQKGTCKCEDVDCTWCHGGVHENDAPTLLTSNPAIGQVSSANFCVYCVRDKFKRYFLIDPQPIG